MDNRRLLIAVLVVIAVIPLYQIGLRQLGNYMGWDLSQPAPTTQPVADAGSSAPTTAQISVPSELNTPPVAAIPDSELRVVPGAANNPIKLGSETEKDQAYRMGITLRPQGAGIDSIILNEFRRQVEHSELYEFQTPVPGHEAVSRPLATRSIWIDDKEINLSDAIWTVESSDVERAVFNITIARGATPVVRVRKVIQLLPKTDPGLGYEVVVQHVVENLTANPLKFRTKFNGATLPPLEQERGGDRQILAGYGSRGFVLITHNMAEEFSSTERLDLKQDSSANPGLWAGTSSNYFNAIVRPIPVDPLQPTAEYISGISADRVAMIGKWPTIITSFQTVEQTLTAGQSVTQSARAFFGPRQRALLNNSYYSAYPQGYDKTLVLTGGPCGFCTFNWLVNMLVSMLAGFHYVFGGFAGKGDWGLAIIGLVVLVRLILHPVSKKSQVAMAKMGKMAPEMERLKKKYGDDKEQLQKAMMELYKEQGIAPMLGCVPMLLQMPIWIALYQSLLTTFELRHAPFLWGWTWIEDLSQPDRLLTWQPVTLLFGITVSGLNILPLLMGVVFYLQMKYQPKPATMTKEQEQQQKMMMWMMPVLFPVMLYTGPSGLNLYIMTSTLIGIIESKKIRDHLKLQDEREKAGRVIVDAGKKFKGGGGKEGGDLLGRGAKTPPPKPGGLMGWLHNLQEKADQIRREADKKK